MIVSTTVTLTYEAIYAMVRAFLMYLIIVDTIIYVKTTHYPPPPAHIAYKESHALVRDDPARERYPKGAPPPENSVERGYKMHESVRTCGVCT